MKAIVLSGGGCKSAWSAGCLQYLLGDLQICYSHFVGVSSGAINAAFLAQFSAGQEKEASEKLIKLWRSITTLDIYKRWQPFGFWHGIWRMSFFDSSPMQQLIRKNISLDKIRASGKHVSIGTVSLSSGKYATFDQNSNDFISAVIASAAFPGAFQPIKIGDELWFDGATKSITPLTTAIELGATEIDVITTSPEKRNKKFINNPTIIDVFKRAFDVSTDKIMSNDLDKAIMYNKLATAGISDKKVVKFNIIRPDYNLIEDLLDFDPKKIKEMIRLGYNDAKTKLSMLKGNIIV